MNNLLKLSVWLAVVSAAHTEETSSSSSFASTIKTLLRGGDGEYLTTQKTNPCATRARPENCIDCIGHNGAGSCQNNDYNVPYTCDEGQNFCCTVSDITNTTFGSKDKYGYCVKDGSSTDNSRTTDCVKNGDVVRMPLYKNPPYSSEQNNMDSLGDNCCSKKVGGVTCVSGTGKDAGGSWYDGSCDGICGAAGGGSVTFVSM